MKIGIFNGNRELDIIIYFVLAQLAAQKTPLHTQTQKQDPIQNKQELCIDQLRTKPNACYNNPIDALLTFYYLLRNSWNFSR